MKTDRRHLGLAAKVARTVLAQLVLLEVPRVQDAQEAEGYRFLLR